jgi:hypothetical protein
MKLAADRTAREIAALIERGATGSAGVEVTPLSSAKRLRKLVS